MIRALSPGKGFSSSFGSAVLALLIADWDVALLAACWGFCCCCFSRRYFSSKAVMSSEVIVMAVGLRRSIAVVDWGGV